MATTAAPGPVPPNPLPKEIFMSRTTVIDVEGMTCQHCVKAVTTEVSRVDGVLKVDVVLHTDVPSEVLVTSDAVLDPRALREAVDEAGYDVAAIHPHD
jgi:copper chaperone